MKSLKESMIEFVVLNVDHVFPDEKTLHDDIPHFPSYLFEEILKKSNRMCWNIQSKYLIPLIRNKNKLKWTDTSYFTGRLLDNYELRLVQKENPMPKSLCLQIDKMTKEHLKVLNKFANHLDHLEIKIREICEEFQKNSGDQNVNLTLRLKHLKYQGHLETYRLNLDPLKLTILELDKSIFKRSFLKVLISFQNLKYLSLHEVKFEDVSLEDAIDSIVTLTFLRNLILSAIKKARGFPTIIDLTMLHAIVSTMDNLETLAISNVKKSSDEFKEPVRKLKHLLTAEPNNADTRVLERYSDNVYYADNVEDILSMCQITSSTNHRADLIWMLFNLLTNDSQSKSAEVFTAVENLSSKFDVLENLLRYNRDDLMYSNFTEDFMLKLACMLFSVHLVHGPRNSFVYNFSPLLKFVKQFITDNKESHLARKFEREISKKML